MTNALVCVYVPSVSWSFSSYVVLPQPLCHWSSGNHALAFLQERVELQYIKPHVQGGVGIGIPDRRQVGPAARPEKKSGPHLKSHKKWVWRPQITKRVWISLNWGRRVLKKPISTLKDRDISQISTGQTFIAQFKHHVSTCILLT